MVKARQKMMFAPTYPKGAAVQPHEKKGVVYTKKWVVELMLDLAGYTEDKDLINTFAIEPSAGEGAFLIEMAKRLVRSCRRHRRPLTSTRNSLMAFELEERSAATARDAVISALKEISVTLHEISLRDSAHVQQH